jgi:Pyruvate/2-oxoacid:ferredoxin oxidoreductase delta subunit
LCTGCEVCAQVCEHRAILYNDQVNVVQEATPASSPE